MKGEPSLEIDTGIPDAKRKEMPKACPGYWRTLKTDGYHWIVTGPMFRSLHGFLQERRRAKGAANAAMLRDLLRSTVSTCGATSDSYPSSASSDPSSQNNTTCVLK